MEVRVLKHTTQPLCKHIKITGSKSESNRLLILQKLYPAIEIENISNAHDTVILKQALSLKENLIKENVIHVGQAGTAMRFLTAFLATCQGRSFLLTGSDRMQQRPIGILVAALRDLGAVIDYPKKEGFPPLQIKGKKLKGGYISINGNISSQYITALLLIAPSLEQGLQVHLQGKITSVPYIKMTLSLLEQIGVPCTFDRNLISVKPRLKIKNTKITVESDWSAASYYYSLAALSSRATVQLAAYKKNSLQGDSILQDIYTNFGVTTAFKDDGIQLTKKDLVPLPPHIHLNLIQAPDIAQTLAVTCFGLGISCDITGLHTLKIKETDRLVALQRELEKLGATVQITEQSLHLQARKEPIKKNVRIATYDDHRMAMAFAPLYLKTSLAIENPQVVSKSYPDFWKDLF